MTRVAQKNFVAAFAAPAGARHDYRYAVEFGFLEAKQTELRDPVTEGGLHGFGGARALHLQRRDIRLLDVNVHARIELHAAGPQKHVGIRDGEPVVVVAELQQQEIVDDSAVVVGEQNVLALPD